MSIDIYGQDTRDAWIAPDGRRMNYWQAQAEVARIVAARGRQRSHAAPRRAPAAHQTPEQTARRTAALQARIATLKARAARQKVHTARIDREARQDRGASGRRV